MKQPNYVVRVTLRNTFICVIYPDIELALTGYSHAIANKSSRLVEMYKISEKANLPLINNK